MPFSGTPQALEIQLWKWDSANNFNNLTKFEPVGGKVTGGTTHIKGLHAF